MIDRINIKEKLNNFGMKFANIGISRPVYDFKTCLYNDFNSCDYTGSDMYLKYDQVETFKIEMLTEDDLKIIIEALQFYSKSTNPQVEEMRREYMIMRRMIEENPYGY